MRIPASMYRPRTFDGYSTVLFLPRGGSVRQARDLAPRSVARGCLSFQNISHSLGSGTFIGEFLSVFVGL